MQYRDAGSRVPSIITQSALAGGGCQRHPPGAVRPGPYPGYRLDTRANGAPWGSVPN
jgi:hypothetical protein